MFEWDENKSQKCFKERGFDFTIVHQFDFASARIVEDDRNDYGETRYLAFNKIDNELYNVVFTMRGENIRIISVRRVRPKEGAKYGF